MSYDENTAERARRRLSRPLDVVEKKMFGGLYFMVNGSMCCSAAGTALVVQIGPEAREQGLLQPHVWPMEMGGRPLANFLRIGPEEATRPMPRSRLGPAASTSSGPSAKHPTSRRKARR